MRMLTPGSSQRKKNGNENAFNILLPWTCRLIAWIIRPRINAKHAAEASIRAIDVCISDANYPRDRTCNRTNYATYGASIQSAANTCTNYSTIHSKSCSVMNNCNGSIYYCLTSSLASLEFERWILHSCIVITDRNSFLQLPASYPEQLIATTSN
jgi:hypothetical protein